MGEKIIGAAGRVVGPSGSRRRRWALLITLAVALGGGMFVMQTVLAVHGANNFELDTPTVGNPPQPGAGANAVTEGGDDWDKVCFEVTQDGNCGISVETTDATAVAWSADCPVTDTPPADLLNCGSLAATIFTGGGSKDPQDITQWAWKDEAGGLPDKDNLLNAFAVRYSLPSSPACPGLGGETLGATKCELLFFGSDRFDNSGDAHQAFWFLQDEVSLGDNKIGGGLGFIGEHRVGDVLVVSAFSNGGTVSTITVYEWDTTCLGDNKSSVNPDPFVLFCDAENIRRLTALDQNSSCYTAGNTTDPYCGVVNNTAGTTSPWPFLNKSGQTTFNTNEFFEAGINLSHFPDLADRCFASLVAETRSATSLTAQLKDFVVTGFGECETTLTTQSERYNAPVSIGGGTVSSGFDTATVTVNGVSTWGGVLDFYLCGPVGESAFCDNGGLLVSNDVAISGAGGVAENRNSGTATLSRVGRYCWFVEFTPDTATAAKGVTGQTHAGVGTGASNTECFYVTAVSPTLTTDAGPTGAAPYSVTFGSAVQDTATLSGLATEPGSNGPNSTYPTINPKTAGTYGGTIRFTLRGPSTTGCGATPASSTGNLNPQDVTVTGNASYGPVFYTPSAPGTYHWQAVYFNASAINNSIGAAADHNALCDQTLEDVTVQQIPTSISTAPWTYPNDEAVITASSGTVPAGNVTFKLFGATMSKTALQNCQDNTGTGATDGVRYMQTVPVAGGGTSATVNTTNTSTYPINLVNQGQHFWRVEFAPTPTTHTGRQSACVEEMSVTVVNAAAPGTVFPPAAVFP